MVTDLDTALSALAEPTRRQVVDLLRARPHRTGELATACGTSGPAMSKHLRILRASGMVDELRVEADARIHLYQLRPEPFLALQAWLDQVQAYWRDQLIAFKAHAEQVVSEQAEHRLTPAIAPPEQAGEAGHDLEEDR